MDNLNTHTDASLYKALASGAKPRFETVMKVVRALGVKLHVDTV